MNDDINLFYIDSGLNLNPKNNLIGLNLSTSKNGTLYIYLFEVNT